MANDLYGFAALTSIACVFAGFICSPYCKLAMMRNSLPSTPASSEASALLASASYGGTIAAVRHLGKSGFKVSVLSSQHIFGAAAWSHWTSRSYWAPRESDNQRFLERLLAVGAADPGQILLPTSDETAWLYTKNITLLAKHFCVYQPSIDCMRRILDKKLLADAAVSAGVAILPTWDPRNMDDLAALAPTLPYPIIIKPRTHIHRLSNDKGIVVNSASELTQQYQWFINREQTQTADDPLLPDAGLPILQQFVNVGREGVYSVTGFIDRTGDLFVTRHVTKVFQRSQPLGVGVCFESRTNDPVLSDAVRRLCQQLAFFGLFEVEFLWFDGHWTAIDFNPRLFNQIGLDIRRGMPLPLLACLDAMGEIATLRYEVAKAQAEQEVTKSVFCDRFTLRAILFAQAMTFRTSHEGRAYWRTWLEQNASQAVDVAADDNDRMPGVIHALSEIYLGLKAFPKFLRTTPRADPMSKHTILKRRHRG